MRHRLINLLVACFAATGVPASASVKITSLAASKGAGNLKLEVWTDVKPADTRAFAALQRNSNWSVWAGSDLKGGPTWVDKALFTVSAAYLSNEAHVYILIPDSAVPKECTTNPACGWILHFFLDQEPKFAQFPQPQASSAGSSLIRPQTADEIARKKDPDLFLSGSYMAYSGSKPIYAIQASLNYSSEIGYSGWTWGPTFKLATAAVPGIDKADLKPRDKIEIDPDTITGAIAFKRTAPGGVGWLRLDLRAGGEFSRDLATSSFVPAAYTEILLKSAGTTVYFVPDILLGFEGGVNLNKPDMILKQPVNLDWYRGIARLVPGIRLTLGKSVAGKQRFSFEGKYVARQPLTDEPFVRYRRGQTDPAKPEEISYTPEILRSRQNRHLATVKGSINFNDYWGFTAEYRYGSEPPLFRFVDHRVIIGLKFSAMFK
jgi:hypothetical protein